MLGSSLDPAGFLLRSLFYSFSRHPGPGPSPAFVSLANREQVVCFGDSFHSQISRDNKDQHLILCNKNSAHIRIHLFRTSETIDQSIDCLRANVMAELVQVLAKDRQPCNLHIPRGRRKEPIVARGQLTSHMYVTHAHALNMF